MYFATPLLLCRLCIIAGDVSPMDVISHIPVLCEDYDVPYIYVNSRAELGTSASTKRATSCVLISPAAAGKGKTAAFEAADKLEECVAEVKELHVVLRDNQKS